MLFLNVFVFLYIYSCSRVSSSRPDVYKRQDVRKVVEWDLYGPALSRRLPEAGPLETIRQANEAVAAFDEAVVSAIDASSRMKPGVTPHWQRIPEETSALALSLIHI